MSFLRQKWKASLECVFLAYPVSEVACPSGYKQSGQARIGRYEEIEERRTYLRMSEASQRKPKLNDTSSSRVSYKEEAAQAHQELHRS